MSRRGLERLCLAAILGFAAILDFTGCRFAQPRHYDTSVDAVHPVLALEALDRVFGERSVAGVKYPRLHFVVAGIVERAALRVRFGGDVAHGYETELLDRLRVSLATAADAGVLAVREAMRGLEQPIGTMIVAGRALSGVCGVLLVLFVFLLARELRGPLAGLLAAFFTAVLYPLVFYAHTLNVETPYLWLAFAALYAAARAMKRDAAGGLVLAAVLAALAVATKDQAYGLFLLPIPWVVARASSRGAVALAAVLAIAAYLLASGWPWDAAGMRMHFEHIFGTGSTSYRVFANDVGGHLGLLRENGLHLLDALGLPLLLLGACGVIWLLFADRRAAAWLLLPAVSYYASYIAPIGYTYLRFVLPIAVLLAIAAAALAARMLEHARARWVALIALLAVLGTRAQLAIDVDRMLLADSNEAASRWLERELPEGARVVAALEEPMHNVLLPPRAQVRLLDPQEPPAAGDAEWFVISSFDPQRTLRDPDPVPTAPPESLHAFGSDWARIALFAPLLPHPLRHGAAFQPTVGVYRRSVR